MRPKIERICQRCGKEFLAHQCAVDRGNAKFCSVACYRNVVAIVEQVCEGCQSPFMVQRSQIAHGMGKYCSRQCYAAHRASKKPERFWAKVNKTSTCWEWTGAVRGWGYGAFGLERYAHRYSWKLHYGEIPESQLVLHKCDNRRCVRPDHLFLGDQQANITDMVQKRRHVHGDNHWTRLNLEKAREHATKMRLGIKR
jgi:hypothetical protein